VPAPGQQHGEGHGQDEGEAEAGADFNHGAVKGVRLQKMGCPRFSLQRGAIPEWADRKMLPSDIRRSRDCPACCALRVWAPLNGPAALMGAMSLLPRGSPP